MKTQINKSYSQILIAIFFLFSIAFGLTGYFYYSHQKEIILKEKYDYLNSVTIFQSREISHWLSDRLSAVDILNENEIIKTHVCNLLKNKNSKADRTFLTMWMQSLKKHFNHRNIYLVDSKQRVVLSLVQAGFAIEQIESDFTRQALQSGKKIFSDFYTDVDGNIEISIHTPILDKGAQHSVLGVLVFEMNPNDDLFPLINSPSWGSKTSETFIAKLEADSVVYISKLKFKSTPPMSFKLPRAKYLLQAVSRSKGLDSMFTGKDYRNVDVAASVKRIPNSNWYLIAKEDLSEIYEPIKTRGVLTMLWVLITIALTAAIVGFVWKKRALQYYKKLYAYESEKDVLANQNIYLTKYANDVILLIGDDCKILQANEKASSVYQYSINELQSMTITDLIAKDDFDCVKKMGEKLFEQDGIITQSYNRRKNNEIFPVEISARKFEIDNKKYVQAIIRDITERKLAENQLKKAEEKYRRIFENTFEGIFQINQNLTFKTVNTPLAKIVGYDSTQELWTNLKSLSEQVWVDPQTTRKLRKLLQLQNSIQNFETKMFKRNREIIWVSINVKPMYELDGTFLHYEGTIEDITARKEAEKEIRMLAHAVESINECVLITDNQNIILFVNEATLTTYGYTKDELIWKHISILRPQNVTRDLEYQILAETTDGGWKGEIINQRKDGTIFPVYLSTSIIKDNKGEPLALIGVATDITETKRAQEELIGAKNKAEEANKLKSRILANMSHELRTPLVSILGYAEFLFDCAKNPEETEMCEGIMEGGKRLAETINLILELSRIETNKSEMNIRLLTIDAVINSSAQFFVRETRGKNLFLNIKFIEPNLQIASDERMLGVIIKNLLSNAVKFTNKGGITIEAQTSVLNEEAYVIIKVSDTGIGIKNENLKLVFEEFRQESEGDNRKFQGAGLGLTLTKKFVELLGGEISVESEFGIGSTFIVKFPTNRSVHFSQDEIHNLKSIEILK